MRKTLQEWLTPTDSENTEEEVVESAPSKQATVLQLLKMEVILIS